MKRFVFIAMLLVVLIGLTGCGRQLMLTPTIFTDGTVDPFFEVPEDQRESRITVLYATDRLEDHPGWGDYGRGRSDTLDLGVCTVEFDGPDNWEVLRRLGTGSRGDSRPGVQVTKTDRLGDLYTSRRDPGDPGSAAVTPPEPDAPATAFLERLEAILDASSQREVTIYIHGFKNGFQEAVKTTGEYAHYAGNQGAFVCYSWPSYNSLWEYAHDRDAARFTCTHLRQFVRLLAEHSSAEKINFLCHSTGAQVLGTLMRELRLLTRDLPAEQARERFRIGQVFLVAPDIDASVARERFLEEGAAELCDHLTIYSSKADYALRYASRYLYREPRLGTVRETGLSEEDVQWLRSLENVTFIDIDRRRRTQTLIGHTHQRYNPAVSSDILLMLRRELTPAERGLTRGEAGLIWHFADDHAERVRETARRVYAPRASGP